MTSAILGTTDGVYRLSGDAVEPLGLAGQRISALHAWHDGTGTTAILAGSYGDGLFRSVNRRGTVDEGRPGTDRAGLPHDRPRSARSSGDPLRHRAGAHLPQP